jgi:hypothetical protein
MQRTDSHTDLREQPGLSSPESPPAWLDALVAEIRHEFSAVRDEVRHEFSAVRGEVHDISRRIDVTLQELGFQSVGIRSE